MAGSRRRQGRYSNRDSAAATKRAKGGWLEGASGARICAGEGWHLSARRPIIPLFLMGGDPHPASLSALVRQGLVGGQSAMARLLAPLLVLVACLGRSLAADITCAFTSLPTQIVDSGVDYAGRSQPPLPTKTYRTRPCSSTSSSSIMTEVSGHVPGWAWSRAGSWRTRKLKLKSY